MKSTTIFILCIALAILAGCNSLSPNSESRPNGSSETSSPSETATQNHVLGIDVSDNVGTIDWNKVKADGYGFAFVKATDGANYSKVDYFYENWPKMKAAGIIRGAYHFYESSDDPKEQANYFASVIAKAGGLGKNDLPPVLDFERATSGANVLIFLRTLKAKTGRNPIIYVNESFASTYLTDPAFTSYPLWLAEYGVSSPKIPAMWKSAGKSWSFWQSNESGKVAGVSGSGETDLDRFNGSLSDLKNFIRNN